MVVEVLSDEIGHSEHSIVFRFYQSQRTLAPMHDAIVLCSCLRLLNNRGSSPSIVVFRGPKPSFYLLFAFSGKTNTFATLNGTGGSSAR